MNDQPLTDLRAFLGSVRLEQLQNLAIAIAESGREPELNATLRESAEAMPIVNEIAAAISDREDAGDNDQKRVLQGQLFLLMAVYRLAEDMGFEW